jgi:hypothetical protein
MAVKLVAKILTYKECLTGFSAPILNKTKDGKHIAVLFE